MQLDVQILVLPGQLVVALQAEGKAQGFHDGYDPLVLLHTDQHIRVAHDPKLRLGIQRLHIAALQRHVVDARLLKGGKYPLQLPVLGLAGLQHPQIAQKQLLLTLQAADRGALAKERHHMVAIQLGVGFGQVKVLRQGLGLAGNGAF